MTATLSLKPIVVEAGRKVKAKGLRLKDFTLKDGLGRITDRQLCVMQMAYVMAMSRKGKLIDVEPGDHPPCVADVISNFAITYNDGVSDEDREKLRPIIPKMLGTKGDGKSRWRRNYLRRLVTEVDRTADAGNGFQDWYAIGLRNASLTHLASYLGGYLAKSDPERGRKVLRKLCKGED